MPRMRRSSSESVGHALSTSTPSSRFEDFFLLFLLDQQPLPSRMVRLVARLASRAQTSFSPKCRQYHTFNRDLSEFIIPETEAKRHSTKPLPLPAELIEPYVRRLACNLDIPSRIRCHYLEDSDAFHKWFKQRGKHTTLNTELFKQEGGSSLVPLEYLGFDPESNTPTFKRFKAPLATFASFVEAPSSKFNLYLAQCDFDSFPERLQEDLEFFPRFLRKYSSENHIYGRNIWIGTPPTYTPLHRDPNHNYYQQLASVKKVRLMSPEMGLKVYSKLANDNSNDWASHADPRGRIRTEEMMASSQRQDLYRAVWENQDPTVEIYEGALERGQALFIPAGWWHSFKSEDQNSISASVSVSHACFSRMFAPC